MWASIVLAMGCSSTGDDAASQGSATGTEATGSAPTAGSAATESSATSIGSGPSSGSDPDDSSGPSATDTGTPPDPTCELDDSCVDDTPSSCGNGACEATDHCDTCDEDCGACTGTSPTVVRGPYLQRAAPDSIVVMWRTSEPTTSAVAYGPSPETMSWATQDEETTTEHEVVISGLTPATRYYYAFGSIDAPLLGKDEDHRFTTFPTPGIEKPTRIWAIGDSGEPGEGQQAVRDAYISYAGDRPANVWLLLGDNAYSDGTDAEHQEAIFDTFAYGDLVKNMVMWPTIGNHERVDADGDESPYFSIFSLPTAAEAGGLASSTEYYYSFDYGMVHFVCLDSDTQSESESAMTWLRNDLQANDKPWLVAYWHHPPYTNGSHNSDLEGTLGEMRENYLPILEEFGVDLVFTGHSHSYERSLLLYGHYGPSEELAQNPGLVLDAQDGDPNGDGPYMKVVARKCPDIGTPVAAGASCGTVYSVVGSSSKVSASDYPTMYDGGVLHPAQFTYKETLGSVVVDIEGNTADVVFLDSGDDSRPMPDYAITDQYRIVK